MIEQSKLEQLLQLFGKQLPPRHLFFATRQTQAIITPAMLKGLYQEPTLGKAYQKLEAEFREFVAAKPEKAKMVPPAKPVPPVVKKPTAPPKVVVKKDE